MAIKPTFLLAPKRMGAVLQTPTNAHDQLDRVHYNNNNNDKNNMYIRYIQESLMLQGLNLMLQCNTLHDMASTCITSSTNFVVMDLFITQLGFLGDK